ncbi:hypothetical protein MHD_06705 [Mannheimia granulomatis]|uniref:Short-chain dehydrogenase n=1 Tax=Mannheimia granulomatis TaxID=85402 RepID=A0A011P8U5_9PAST|nr:SDR family NAD(P)-dependent oxidoreductase [Mannheimia granulomatis]EXI62809.1 short-chain dehydrogenase [Mannheimia granulomatis]RGE48165.1 hypothetical protein MHD_06705 [Mannheimia granulomatis]
MKTYLITGASGGLGLHLTQTILANGHRVIATSRKADAFAQLCEQYPNTLQTEVLDILNINDLKALANKHQNIDVLINNAGGAVIGAMEEHTDADINQQLALNLLAPIHLSRAFLPQMRARKSGKIVFVTSIGGRMAFAGGSLYHTAKFGLEGFAETLAQEVAEFGIQTLIVEPGSIKSEFLNNIKWTNKLPEYQGSTVDKLGEYIANSEEHISGDPALMAKAIYELTTQDNPPLRTALGVDAFNGLQTAYQSHLDTLNAQKDLALSVAIAGKTGFTG